MVGARCSQMNLLVETGAILFFLLSLGLTSIVRAPLREYIHLIAGIIVLMQLIPVFASRGRQSHRTSRLVQTLFHSDRKASHCAVIVIISVVTNSSHRFRIFVSGIVGTIRLIAEPIIGGNQVLGFFSAFAVDVTP